VLTVFNAILAGFGAVTLIFGDARDALSGHYHRECRDRDQSGGACQASAGPAFVARGAAGEGEAQRVGDAAAVEEVVVGDVVVLEPGDRVIADGRVMTANDLRIDESILTGESEPVHRAVGENVRSGAFVV
jgi:cation-transporting P-type ATPase E